eukprot:Nk52_evm19s265 gene=Nk52_evmTU19s265
MFQAGHVLYSACRAGISVGARQGIIGWAAGSAQCRLSVGRCLCAGSADYLQNYRSLYGRRKGLNSNHFVVSRGLATGRPKIYTKTGDKGKTSLYTGERRSKADVTFEALGSTDELNSFIGLAKEYCLITNNGLCDKLQKIQCILQEVGSNIATPRNKSGPARRDKTKFNPEYVTLVEKWIDELDDELPQLLRFILPSGGLSSAHLHVARSVCRRAERTIVPLVNDGAVDEDCLHFLNRLSDFLFNAARYASMKEGNVEYTWDPAINILKEEKHSKKEDGK